MAYSEKVIEHYENPRNVGSFDKDDPSIGTGLVGAPACGDVMKLQLKITDEGIIEDAKFKTFGCGSAIASSSLATEWVKGMSIDKAEQIGMDWWRTDPRLSSHAPARAIPQPTPAASAARQQESRHGS